MPRRAAPGPGRAPRRARGKFRRSRGAQSAAERCRCAGAMWPPKTPTWTPSFANLKDKVSTAPSGPAPLPRGRGGPPSSERSRERRGEGGRVSPGARRRPCDLPRGERVGDSQAVSPRVFIDRATPGDGAIPASVFPRGPGTPRPPNPRAGTGGPGWRGGGPGRLDGGTGCTPARSGSPPVCLQLCALGGRRPW